MGKKTWGKKLVLFKYIFVSIQNVQKYQRSSFMPSKKIWSPNPCSGQQSLTCQFIQGKLSNFPNRLGLIALHKIHDCSKSLRSNLILSD